jgi:hypothetical protein
MARSESVAHKNFARKSNDLQIWQWTMLHEMLDALLDVFFHPKKSCTRCRGEARRLIDKRSRLLREGSRLQQVLKPRDSPDITMTLKPSLSSEWGQHR